MDQWSCTCFLHCPGSDFVLVGCFIELNTIIIIRCKCMHYIELNTIIIIRCKCMHYIELNTIIIIRCKCMHYIELNTIIIKRCKCMHYIELNTIIIIRCKCTHYVWHTCDSSSIARVVLKSIIYFVIDNIAVSDLTEVIYNCKRVFLPYWGVLYVP